MPWEKTCVIDEKVKLIGECLKKEYSITDLSRYFSISRKTIYKWLNRYQVAGLEALNEMARIPHSHPATTSEEIVSKIIDVKLKHQRWGPKKVVAWLNNKYPEDSWPVASTAGKILKREGLVKAKHKRHHVPPYTQPFESCEKPNDVWSIDYKGQFRMRDGRLCYPLTISDNYSRFLLLCRGLLHPNYESTQPWLEWTFREYGLPKAIKSDNGEPFASVALGGLTKLSIWMIKLGIVPERIAVGHPEQNGRHERMHKTLKEYAVSPPRANLRQQQMVFDRFVQEYDFEYPHEAIGLKPPVTCYIASVKQLPGKLPEVVYGSEYLVRRVRTNGEIRWKGKLMYICEALEGEPIGLKQINERYWEISFSFHLLGYFDEITGKICHGIN
jgi:transposase InsO family protein